MFDETNLRVLFSCVKIFSIISQVASQYQQEQATLMAKCEAIMTFGEGCVDDYCHKKCGGLCTITPSSNQAVCVCFPGQSKGDVSRCYGTTSTGSSDGTLSAQAAICQGNCNEVISQINPRIYALAAMCQDISQGETPARYCVCSAHHIGFYLRGIFPGSFAKAALAASSPEVSVITSGNNDEEAESKRIGKVLPHVSPVSPSQFILQFSEKNEGRASNGSKIINFSSASSPIRSSLTLLDLIPPPANTSAIATIPSVTRNRRLSTVTSNSIRTSCNHIILLLLYFFQLFTILCPTNTFKS